MTPLATVFMAVSWAVVLGLTAWCYRRVLAAGKGKEEGGPEAGPGAASPRLPPESW